MNIITQIVEPAIQVLSQASTMRPLRSRQNGDQQALNTPGFNTSLNKQKKLPGQGQSALDWTISRQTVPKLTHLFWPKAKPLSRARTSRGSQG